MSFNLQLSKSENIKAMFSAPKWLPVCIQFRLPIAKWRNIRSTALSKSCDNCCYPNFSFIPTFSNKNANSLIDR